MKYIYVKDGVLGVTLDNKPNWYLDSGEPPSDQWFIDNEGLYPLVGDYDGHSNKIVKPETEWIIEDDRVSKTYYTVIDNGRDGVVETVGRYLEMKDQSEWSVDGDNITVTYNEKTRMDSEVREFISKNFVDDNGYDEDIHQLKLPFEWIWDRDSNIIRKDYFTVIRLEDDDMEDPIFYDINILPWTEWTVLPENVLSETYVATELSIDQIKINLKDFLADYRWNIEVGGCVYDGVSIHTDRESQSKLASTYSVIKSGVYEGDVEWKVFDGFRTYTQEDFISMSLYVFGFIDEIYKKESSIMDQIDAAPTKEQLLSVRNSIETEMHNTKSVFCTT